MKVCTSFWKHPILIVLCITIFSFCVYVLFNSLPFTSKYIKTAQRNYTSEHFVFECIKIITIFVSLYISIQSLTISLETKKKEPFRRTFQMSVNPGVVPYNCGMNWGSWSCTGFDTQKAKNICQSVVNNNIACRVVAGCESGKPVTNASCIEVVLD